MYQAFGMPHTILNFYSIMFGLAAKGTLAKNIQKPTQRLHIRKSRNC